VRDRLDILALDVDGRLVVLELKRDDAPTDIHLRAIRYAALVSRLTEEDLAGIHARFVRRRGGDLTDEGALEAIRAHVDGELDPLLLRRPRLVLVAGNFLDEWLRPPYGSSADQVAEAADVHQCIFCKPPSVGS
jgi:hypothetical protein